MGSPRRYFTSGFDINDAKLMTFLSEMICEFGLDCVIARRRRGQSEPAKNKAWVLAESGGDDAAGEAYTGRSSFSFSLHSQAELESMAVNQTALMVNLKNGFLIHYKPQELKWKGIDSGLIRFSSSQIVSATRNFCTGRVVGRGALSCVYRGRMGLGRTPVAIKRLDRGHQESAKAFCRELMIAGSLHDRHVVRLMGFCIDAEEGLFLVYQYVSSGSLERFLHGKSRLMPWSDRYKVAIKIAEAIEYLHTGTGRCVVHRDIKPSNILLSSGKSPKLCDFGLAVWTPAPSVSFLCKKVKGTFGYLAPEYFQHGKVSDRTDVYAFGIVLLELLTGRKPIDSIRGPREKNLVLWATPLLQQGSMEKLLDPRLMVTRRNTNQIARMVRAVATCMNEESRRPAMGDILTILGRSKSGCFSRAKAILPDKPIDFHPPLQSTESEIEYFMSAMFEDD